MSQCRRIQTVTVQALALLSLTLLTSLASLASASSNYMDPNNYCLNRQISIDPNLDTVQVEGETESFNFYHDTCASAGTVDTDIVADTAAVNANVSNSNEDTHIAMFDVSPYYQHQQQQQQQQLYNQYMQQRQQQIQDATNTNTNTNTLASTAASFIAMGECSFMSYLQDKVNINWDDVNFDEDDEDDEDDDEDDGHSSMLSNASIRRRVVAVGAEGPPPSSSAYTHTTNGQGPTSNSMRNGRTFTPTAFRSRHVSSSSTTSSSSSLNKVLQMRGGASPTASAAADEFAKRLLAAAAVTVLYEGMIGHIFEFLKIGMQTAPIGTTYLSIMRRITDEKGIAGAWDGFVPWGVIQAIFKGGVFGLALSMAKTYLSPLAERGYLSDNTVATLCGGIAGGVQGFVLSPLLLLKTRVMTNPVFRENMSLLRTTFLSLTIGMEVVKNEGVLALMKGCDIFAVKRVFDWSTRYYFSEVFKSMMLQYGAGVDGVLSSAEKISASLMAGVVSTFMTLPMDVIVAKSQDAKKAGVKVSAWETFIQDYKEGGWKGLYDANMMGFEIRLIHVCGTTVVMQFGSPLMFEFLFNRKK